MPLFSAEGTSSYLLAQVVFIMYPRSYCLSIHAALYRRSSCNLKLPVLIAKSGLLSNRVSLETFASSSESFRNLITFVMSTALRPESSLRSQLNLSCDEDLVMPGVFVWQDFRLFIRNCSSSRLYESLAAAGSYANASPNIHTVARYAFRTLHAAILNRLCANVTSYILFCGSKGSH